MGRQPGGTECLDGNAAIAGRDKLACTFGDLNRIKVRLSITLQLEATFLTLAVVWRRGPDCHFGGQNILGADVLALSNPKELRTFFNDLAVSPDCKIGPRRQ